jgi:hypothetical protein
MVGLTRSGQIVYRPPWLKGAVAGIALLLCWLPLGSAHTGLPTPILVDHMIGPYPVSVWADPEVGTGTFFIRLEPPSDGAIPGDTVVQIGVQPVNGRLAEAHYTARLQEIGGRVQYQAEVPFDAQELWRVRIIVRSSGGSGEAAIDIEAIPLGLGQWDVLLYLCPFLAVGFLGLQMVLYGRKRNQAQKRAVRRWHRSET